MTSQLGKAPNMASPSEYFTNVLQYVPQGHEKALKQAFYTTAANLFVLFAVAGGVAVFFVLEAFLRPLLWAGLCGTFLFPFKRTLTRALRSWLRGLAQSNTPIAVGIVVLPISVVNRSSDLLSEFFRNHVKLIAGVLVGLPSLYLLYYFGPLMRILGIIQLILHVFHELLGYFSSGWVLTACAAYLLAVVFLWREESRRVLRLLAIPVWVSLILNFSTLAGALRVPLLLATVTVMIIGFVAEVNQARKERAAKGQDASPTMSAFKLLLLGDAEGEASAPDTRDNADQPSVPSARSKSDSEVSKPSSLPVVPEKGPATTAASSSFSASSQGPTSVGSTESVTETDQKRRLLSTQCLIALLWAHIIVRLWLHVWAVSLVLLVPIALSILKKVGMQLQEGLLRERLHCLKTKLTSWVQSRQDVLAPRSIRGLCKLAILGDKKVVSVLEQSLDMATSSLMILALLVGVTLFSFIFAFQIHQESMHLVTLTGNLFNNTVNPVSQWLPNSDDMQEAVDSMVGNVYTYGRDYITSKVREFVSPDGNNTELEEQVLQIWDQLYENWFSKGNASRSGQVCWNALLQNSLGFLYQCNAQGQNQTSVARPGFAMPDLTNLTAVWDTVSQSAALFDVGAAVAFVKENIGVFVSVLESVWLVVKGNMNLVLSIVTATISIILGSGTAVLNFLISAAIFMTTLFYLLAYSGSQYKPFEWVQRLGPAQAAPSRFSQAVEEAISGVFMASFKMATFYGLYTWLTHLVFAINIVFIPSALAAIFAAVPFVGTYWAAFPGVLELWLAKGQGLMAVLLIVCHLLPSYVVDTAIYSEIRGGHPFLTGLAIVGGISCLGLEGALIGPILLCFVLVCISVYSTMLKQDPTPTAGGQ